MTQAISLVLFDLDDARRAATRTRASVLDLVRRLRVRSAVLTNDPTLIAEHITSAGIKAVKPDSACFLGCLAALGVDSAETLFIGDLAENVDGARAAGLAAHRYVSVELLSRMLQEHNLLAGYGPFTQGITLSPRIAGLPRPRAPPRPVHASRTEA